MAMDESYDPQYMSMSPSGPQPQRIVQACNPCRKGKRKCDGNLPCGRCVSLQKECFRDNAQGDDTGEKKRKRKPASKGEPVAEMGGKVKRPTDVNSSAVAMSGGNTVATNGATSTGLSSQVMMMEGIVDALFMRFLAENFYNYYGAQFSFTGGIVSWDAENHYSTLARGVRADAMFATACRGLGMIGPSKRFFQRALSNSNLIMNELSVDAMTALITLVMSTWGNDTNVTFRIMNLAASLNAQYAPAAALTAPGFELRPSEPITGNPNALYAYVGRVLGMIMEPVALEVHKQVILRIFGALNIVAPNVRSAVAAIPPAETMFLGPFDYAEFLCGRGATPPPMDVHMALHLLREFDSLEGKLRLMMPQLTKVTTTEVIKILTNKFVFAATVRRAVLHFVAGDFETSRKMAFASTQNFKLIQTMMSPENTVELAHILDLSVSLRDQILFDETLSYLRRLAPANDTAAILVRALADAPKVWNGQMQQPIQPPAILPPVTFEMPIVAPAPAAGLIDTSFLFDDVEHLFQQHDTFM